MEYSLKDLLRFIEENDVKFIRLAFCDPFGEQKNLAIMASQLPHAAVDGVSFDASALHGFATAEDSDLFLAPDLSTFALLPWRPAQEGVARFYCNIRRPGGEAYESDCRRILSQTVAKAEAAGYAFQIGPECEFYLFRTDEAGFPTLSPHDRAGYCDIAPADQGEDVRRQICLTLEEMGIQPERSHHEQGPGQNEIDFRCASPLRAADDLMALRAAVKAVASQNGLFASFLPKPLEDKSGSGLHLNLSLHQDGRNLFESFSSAPHPKAASFLAGILRRMPDVTAFANPLPGSYNRLGRLEAPATVGWSCRNRSQLVRVPAAPPAGSRIEVRSPDPACNPYLVLALLIEAGLEGIEEGLILPAENRFDFYTADEEVRGRQVWLPKTLGEALDTAAKSDFISRVLPKPLTDGYLACRRREFSQYERSGNRRQYEIEHYFFKV